MRRAKIKDRGVVTRFSQTKFIGVLHAHGCPRCRLRYEDACETPERDGRCNSCISGRISRYQAATEPQDCCRRACKRASSQQRITYKLAGDGPWWICATCRRQHPFTNPAGGSQ